METTSDIRAETRPGYTGFRADDGEGGGIGSELRRPRWSKAPAMYASTMAAYAQSWFRWLSITKQEMAKAEKPAQSLISSGIPSPPNRKRLVAQPSWRCGLAAVEAQDGCNAGRLWFAVEGDVMGKGHRARIYQRKVSSAVGGGHAAAPSEGLVT